MDYFSIKTTQIKMVRDRGYIIDPDEARLLEKKGMENYELWKQVRRQTVSNLDVTKEHNLLSRAYTTPSNTNLLYVSYVNSGKDKSTGVALLNKVISMIEASNDKIINDNIARGMDTQEGVYTHIIFISNTPLSSPAKKYLFALIDPNDAKDAENLKKYNFDFNFFTYSELTYSPIEHKDSPEYILIPEPEKSQVYEKMKVNAARLNIMLTSDPIARYYNFKEGDLLLIKRRDLMIPLLNPDSINYRIVLETVEKK